MTPITALRLRPHFPLRFALAVLVLSLATAAGIAAAAHQSRAPILAWEIQFSGTSAGLRGVAAVDAVTAWASGSEGTVLRTVDGGETWTRKKVPGAEGVDFRDIEAFDAQTAVVMGIASPARIFRTADGGETWAEVYHDNASGIFLDGIDFSGPLDGWAVGDPIGGRLFVLTTSDGGKTWVKPSSVRRPYAQKAEGLFAAGGTCIEARSATEVRFCSGGLISRIFHTTDGGRSWDIRDSPLLKGQPSFGTYALAFRNERDGIAVGGDYRDEPAAEKNAAFSMDGGLSWTVVNDRKPAGLRESVAFVPGAATAMAIAVGPTGSDFTLDGGRSWTAIPGPQGFHAVSFAADGTAGWAVGKGGIIARIRMGR
jgi:photosystem II stability/assembly factor-like uncharacterized protein